MKTKQLIVRIAFGLIVYVAGGARAEWITLDYPGSSATYANGIDGDNIVGSYIDSSGKSHGFLYDGTCWTTLDYPSSNVTVLEDISGTNIVGYFMIFQPLWHCAGFIYDGTTWTMLSYHGKWIDTTRATGIDGGNIVGWFMDWLGRSHGFLYNGTTWTILDNPSLFGTQLYGIDGDMIVANGFLYDGTNWTELVGFPSGIDGDNIVGSYTDSSGKTHGLVYDGMNWSWLDYPGSDWTVANGIDGDRIVGYYCDSLGTHGFLYRPDVVLHATVDIDPDTLNLKSNGKWITCYIELSHGYNVSNIDVSTIKLNNTVSADAKPTAIGDYDSDGIADLMVKFNRSAVQEILQIGEVELTVTGQLNDGKLFGGSDTIRIINPGGKKL